MPQISPPMNPKVQKRLIACCSGLCLVGAVVVQFCFPAQDAIQGSFIRIGMVLAALAWALPGPGERFGWQKLVPLLIAFVILMAVTKKMILFLIPALIVLGIALKVTRPNTRPPVLRKPGK